METKQNIPSYFKYILWFGFLGYLLLTAVLPMIFPAEPIQLPNGQWVSDRAFYEGFSLFFADILKIGIFGGLFWLFDKYVMKTIDTIKELQNRNVAYAIFLLAVAVLFHAVLSNT